MTSGAQPVLRLTMLLATVLAGAPALAQAPHCPAPASGTGGAWAPPLDRVVTLQSSGASLRTAL
ncbi:MAG TPA: hypothetical protein VE861_02110, partial [Gemmatimonadaceae bacterium]|nr:hypothetical protein [Gemmatimonadaceae bacterium]